MAFRSPKYDYKVRLLVNLEPICPCSFVVYKSLFFFILRRFMQVSDESGKTFFDRKSVFSKGVNLALSMAFFFELLK